MPADTRVFGVRHHGPGSARAVEAALADFRPNVVLVEGPPDADALIRFLPEITPPAAILVYREDQPACAAFYPFARFSPEWNALRWAHDNGVEARFCDLPHQFQMAATPEEVADTEQAATRAAFAQAAGFADHAEWWDDEIELRRPAPEHFDAILEAMRAMRTRPAVGREARREAWMRRTVREAEREGHGRIAVIVGAWHAPALVDRPKVAEDDALLRGMPKVKVGATWVPWSHTRLGHWTGYGAGIDAPGWFDAVWADRAAAPTRWLIDAARALRTADVDAPPASVIEALRLAEALAALRDRPHPGLDELDDAVDAVMIRAEPALRAIVNARVRVGSTLGEVPDSVPSFPLQRDLEARQKAVRLKPSDELRTLDLDLREDGGHARSVLLRQLDIIGVGWGRLLDHSGTGSFRERWELRWVPSLAAAVVEAAPLGTTVVAAAETSVRERAAIELEPDTLATLLERARLAELDAADTVLDHLVQRSVAGRDLRPILSAIPPLVRILRHGDVRGHARAVRPVVDGLILRATIGLPTAAAGLDDDAAAGLAEAMAAADDAMVLIDARSPDWSAMLATLTEAPVSGRLRGQVARLRLSRAELDAEGLGAIAARALSPAVPPRDAAGWVDGLLRSGSAGLLTLPDLWSALDTWLLAQPEERFLEALPILRRAFSPFTGPERARMARMLHRLGAPTPVLQALDPERVARLMPILHTLLAPADGALLSAGAAPAPGATDRPAER